MDPIIEHFQTYMNLYIVGALVVLPPVVYFRKHTFPAIYHTFEYFLYCGIAHIVLYGLVGMFSWFRQETAFKNYDGSVNANFTGYKTPFFTFWDRALYSPEGLFYFEIALAMLLLYVVIFIRPTRFRKRNWTTTQKKKNDAKTKTGKPRYNRGSQFRSGA